jgi:hypothetical protein
MTMTDAYGIAKRWRPCHVGVDTSEIDRCLSNIADISPRLALQMGDLIVDLIDRMDASAWYAEREREERAAD